MSDEADRKEHVFHFWPRLRLAGLLHGYAEAADTGRELIDAHPEEGYLYYNTACCESLAGRTPDAVEHLRWAIDIWDGCREMAAADSDFDPIRDEPAFQGLLTNRPA